MRKENLEALVKKLEENGFDRDRIVHEYVSSASKNDVIRVINNHFYNEDEKRAFINKKSLSDVFDYYSIQMLDQDQINAARMSKINKTLDEKRSVEKMYGNGFSKEEILDLYNKNISMNEIYRQTGVAPVTVSKIVNEFGGVIRKQIEYTDILEKMKEIGITKEKVNDFYIVQNRTQNDLKAWLSKETGYEVGNKSLEKILKHFQLEKSNFQVRQLQGNRSRVQKVYNRNALNDAGFASVEDVAKFYDENPSETWESIANKLNSKIGSQFFTVRWLSRNVVPHSKRSKERGRSREEMNLEKFIVEDIGLNPKTSDRTTIHPMELDMYFEEEKVAIEFNGNYWHSDNFFYENQKMSAQDYHMKKFEKCVDKGIQLLFVWEGDWNMSQEEVKEAIRTYFATKIVSPILMKI